MPYRELAPTDPLTPIEDVVRGLKRYPVVVPHQLDGQAWWGELPTGHEHERDKGIEPVVSLLGLRAPPSRSESMEFRKRFRWLTLLVLLIFVGLLGRMIQLQWPWVQGRHHGAQAPQMR